MKSEPVFSKPIIPVINPEDQRDLPQISYYVREDSQGPYLIRVRETIANETKQTYARVTELLRRYHPGIRQIPINLDLP
jgi:hypothetical protein